LWNSALLLATSGSPSTSTDFCSYFDGSSISPKDALSFWPSSHTSFANWSFDSVPIYLRFLNMSSDILIGFSSFSPLGSNYS